METLKLEKDGSIYKLTLNRPEVRNAFNEKMISELTQVFKTLQHDSQCRVLILKGEGESFCAGADLNWMKSMAQYTQEENYKDSDQLFEMFSAQENLPMPVIGLVQGHVFGGALGLVAVCDIVAAIEETQFCFSEVRLGLAPAVISSFVAKKMAKSQIHRWFLTGEVFESSQALEMDFIHFTDSKKKVEKFVEKTAEQIVNNGPVAVRETKKLIKDLSENPNIRKRSVQLIADLRVGAEGQEGLKAFFEKRKPNWKVSK